MRDFFERHEILNSASAIAFQVLFALVPLALFTLALAGFLDLGRVWEDAAAELESRVSPAAFTVIDDTVTKVIESRQPFWLTLGAALAIWRLSAAMRATMGALDRIYEADDDERSFVAEIRTSIGLSLTTTILVLLSLAVLYLGPVVVDAEGAVAGGLSFLVRWILAFALGIVAVGLIVHYAPSHPQPLGWVSRGTLLAAACWLVASGGFALYVTELADYGSVFGSFATIFLLLTYLYLSAAAFLVGVEIDVTARDEAETAPNARRARRDAGPVEATAVERVA